ncbi:MAG: 50S ribosomal protein L4 [Clostridia bacterium]
MKLNVLNMAGKSAGTVEVSDNIFGCEYNEALIHQVVVAQLANKRQGTQCALTRSEVRGGGAKPYKQKGTGRARQGSIVSPQFVGGGVVFAKKPRDFSQKINVKMKKAAFYSALSEKFRQNEIVVLDKFALSEPKTKLVAEAVKTLNIGGNVLFVVEEYDELMLRAIKNIPTAQLCEARTLNVYDVVATKNVVLTVGAIKKLEEAAQ